MYLWLGTYHVGLDILKENLKYLHVSTSPDLRLEVCITMFGFLKCGFWVLNARQTLSLEHLACLFLLLCLSSLEIWYTKPCIRSIFKLKYKVDHADSKECILEHWFSFIFDLISSERPQPQSLKSWTWGNNSSSLIFYLCAVWEWQSTYVEIHM